MTKRPQKYVPSPGVWASGTLTMAGFLIGIGFYFDPTALLPAVILRLILDVRCRVVFSVARAPPQQLQQQTTAAGAAAAAAAAETHQPSTVLL
jgi:hypothetical protein